MQIGFIGLGNMGAPMARNLAAAGHAVTGFDVAGVAVEGVAPAASAAAAAARPRRRRHHAAERRDPARGLRRDRAGRPPRRASSSTARPSTSRAPAPSPPRPRRRASSPVDAPVSGGTGGAAAGTLTFMAGGSARGLRAGPAALRGDGLARRPLRRRRRRPGGEDLQQHAARHLDDRHLRGLRARRQARPRPARALRRGLDLLRRLLVGDELLPGARRRPRPRPPTTTTAPASPPS